MKTEEIIKIFLILFVLYLLLNCIMTEKTSDEKFADTLDNEVKILSGDEDFVLARFSDFKNAHKHLLLKHLFSKYDAVSTDTDKQFNTFLTGENINDLRPYTESIDNINNLSESIFSKIPLFIIEKSNIKDYLIESNNPPIITDQGIKDKTSEKYTYYHTLSKMIFISENPKPNSIELKKNSNDTKAFNKLSKIEIVIEGDKKLEYYVLSDEGVDFTWNLTN